MSFEKGQVPAALLEYTEALPPRFDLSHDRIGTLPPKPIRRKAKKAK